MVVITLEEVRDRLSHWLLLQNRSVDLRWIARIRLLVYSDLFVKRVAFSLDWWLINFFEFIGEFLLVRRIFEQLLNCVRRFIKIHTQLNNIKTKTLFSISGRLLRKSEIGNLSFVLAKITKLRNTQQNGTYQVNRPQANWSQSATQTLSK